MSEEIMGKNNRQLFAIFLTCIFSWFFAYLAINVFKDYATGLFIWLPVVLGASATMIYGYKNDVSKKALRLTAFIGPSGVTTSFTPFIKGYRST